MTTTWLHFGIRNSSLRAMGAGAKIVLVSLQKASDHFSAIRGVSEPLLPLALLGCCHDSFLRGVWVTEVKVLFDSDYSGGDGASTSFLL